jgi:FAD/FMN-containing dehydrogenase
MKAGAFYSRPYGLWADLAYRNDPQTVKALEMVKNMLDPSRVMNPGKLCFRGEV